MPDAGAFGEGDECGGFDGSEKQVVVAARGTVDVDALDDVRQRSRRRAARRVGRGADPTPGGDLRRADQHDRRRRGGRLREAGGERGGAGVSRHGAVAVAAAAAAFKLFARRADVVLRRLGRVFLTLTGRF